MVSKPALGALLAILLACPPSLRAQSDSRAVQSAQDLKRLTIEELSQLDVTSVSRRPERQSDVAAAVSVIRDTDLSRSGVASFAEAMRLADAVDVAHVNPNTWSVTARGFNISTANKLLVLIDGRSVYSPLFSGTFWEVQDAVFADVDRIEVVRGPGGATWGANAVNGVVNIITKSAAATVGNVAMVTAGTDEHPIVSGRHGGPAWGGGNYRVYGKFRQRGAGVDATTGAGAGNELLMGHGGFRLDTDDRLESQWFVQGELYRGQVGLVNRPDGDLAGGSLLARYTRRLSSTSEFSGQAYYDRTWRKIPQQFEELRDTVDLDVTQTLVVRSRHNLVFGGNIRVSHGTDRGVAGFFFDPEERTNELFSVFAQDEIALRPNRLFLIVGSKFEGNDYTGLDVQPTLRVRWTRSGRDTLWGAVSRAVRLPTRFDTDLRIVNPITQQVLIAGSEDFESESVVAYEGGYRVQPHPRAAFDLAVYANRYDDLRSQELPLTPGAPVRLANLLNAFTSGVEVSATFQAAENWRVHGSYAYMYEDFSRDPDSTDLSGGMFEANDPSHLFKLRSYLDLPKGLQFDGVFRAVSSRPAPHVPAYAELDLRLGWTVRTGWELSFMGQNLLNDTHAELFSPGAPRYEFERAAHVRSTWRF
jgi:iron complex outermembrane recepter protein